MSETEVATEHQEVDTDNLDAFADDFFGQKPSKEAPKTKEPEAAQEGDAEEVVAAEAQTDAEDEAELEQEVKEPVKKKQTVQERIDEVVRQREEIRRDGDAKIEALRKEFEEYKKGSQPAPVEAKEPQPDALKEDGTPVYQLGEFDPNYIRDLTRFTLETERSKAQAEWAEQQRVNSVQQEQQALQAGWNTKVEAATVENPDFVEKGQALLVNFENLDPGYAGYLSSALMNMEKGTDVLYYLANHPDEAKAIVNSGAQKATLALGRIEARFLTGDENVPRAKVTKAPAPPPVRARGTNGAFIAVEPDTDDLDLFEAEFFKK